MKKQLCILLVCMMLSGLMCLPAQASLEPAVEAAYNTAVQGQDTLDGLDVSVVEKTTSALTNVSSEKKVEMKVSGIKGTSLKADIKVTTGETSSENYYRDSYYYSTTSDGNIKQEMDRASIWDIINAHTYTDLTSNYLNMLCSETAADGTTTYLYAADSDKLGDYAKRFLQGAGEEQGLVINSLQGSMETDKDSHVTKRNLQVVYTITQGENSETFLLQTEVTFHQSGEVINVSLPDLSGYKELEASKPVETITPVTKTVYLTTDVNVRAAGDISSVILGGIYAGTAVMETGFTSDGWIQIQYNQTVGYVWGDYVSEKKPVQTSAGSGTMYATADVNIRDTHSSDGAIIGTLSKGTSIEITGTTTNGWIRVKYNGKTGYIYADYLTWTVPIADTYVKDGYVSGLVTDASLGVLTITRDDGQGSATFNTTYAQMNFKDTIYTGDWVEIYYYGAGAPYTASKVNDYTRHDEEEAIEQSVTVEGVITKCSPDSLELLCSDGIYRTFDISNTDFEMSDDLYEGRYVQVSWMSTTGGAETKQIPALRVKGE